MLSRKIDADIISAYGPRSSPNWEFVEKRYLSAPYAKLIDELGTVGNIQETTDLNDDVSVVLFISLGDVDGICVRLSLVGKFACISDDQGQMLSRVELQQDKRASIIHDLLATHETVLLEPDELRRQIEFGDGQQTIYGALFSADESIV